MASKDLTNDPKAIDVSNPEQHYQIQCQEVRLVSVTMRMLDPEKEKEGESRFIFRVRVDVYGNEALGTLDTQMVYVTSEPAEPLAGAWLRFELTGLFSAEEGIASEALGDFARLFTLSILWPYAREYAADQIRRTGQPSPTLPIINPQTVTQALIEADLVEVVIHEKGQVRNG